MNVNVKYHDIAKISVNFAIQIELSEIVETPECKFPSW